MQDNNKKNKKKEELLQALGNAKHDAQNLASKGRKIVKEGQFVADLAACNEEFISCIPDDSFFTTRQWNNQIGSWNRWRNSASTELNEMDRLSFATDSTSVATSASISSVYIPSLPRPSQDSARKAYERFSHILEQTNPIHELEVEIRRLGLITSQSNNESILALLNQAEQAFKVPSVQGISPSAVLIPLREAINRTFADLLQRRPKQEKTSNPQEKSRSICTQCSRPGVDDAQIEQLADEAGELNKLLSEAKQDVMSRDRVRELMNRGFLFLRSFLRLLDRNKMRN